MKISKSLLPAAALAALFAGCQDEDFGYNATDIKKDVYSKTFAETFGTPDPNQDWTMAALITANVSVGSNAVAFVYTDMPGTNGATLAGIVEGKTAQFNVVKGTKQVYAIVKENGKRIVAGYFNVENGIVNITSSPVAKLSSLTRGEGDGTGLSIAEAPSFTHVAYDPSEYIWDEVTFCIDGKYFFTYENGKYELYSKTALNSNGKMVEGGTFFEVTPTKIEESSYSYWIWTCELTDEEYAEYFGATMLKDIMGKVEFKEDGSPKWYATEAYNKSGVRKYESKKHWDAPYYKIIGDTKTTDVTWRIGDCNNLFWVDDAVFLESEDYRSDRKKAIYAKYGASVESLEKGVVFTTSKDDAQIEIPMMYGATILSNAFGYYYYTENEDPRSVNRYILYEDARPSTNIKVDGTAVGGMSLASMQNGWTDESEVTCTSRRLVYFDENGNGSFNFPKDVKIGFFIIHNHDMDTEGNGYASLNGATAETTWTYSDPSLNEKYFYDEAGKNQTLNDTWSYRPSGDNRTFDNSRGNVKAITWMYNNRVLCGFGDDTGDHDLNDFVWWVKGDIKETPDIDINTLESNHWIVACEDLGGTFDYDFNDLVFALRKTQLEEDITKAKLELVPLAAGGTLEAHVVYDDEDKGEIHSLLEGSNTTDPINVLTAGATPAAGKAVLLAEEVDWNSDINAILQNVKVKVTQSKDADAVESNYFISGYDKHENEEDNSTVPQMILLPAGWDWPTENTPVNMVYAKFADWVSDVDVTDWCNTKDGENSTEYVVNPLPKPSEESGEGGGNTPPSGPTTVTYTINLQECAEYNSYDWQGIQEGWGYAIEFSSVDFTEANKVTLEIVADQDLSLALQSNKSWSSCNHEFVGGSASTNQELTFNSVPSSWSGVYFKTSVALTNAQAILKIKK